MQFTNMSTEEWGGSKRRGLVWSKGGIGKKKDRPSRIS